MERVAAVEGPEVSWNQRESCPEGGGGWGGLVCVEMVLGGASVQGLPKGPSKGLTV